MGRSRVLEIQKCRDFINKEYFLNKTLEKNIEPRQGLAISAGVIKPSPVGGFPSEVINENKVLDTIYILFSVILLLLTVIGPAIKSIECGDTLYC